MLTLNDITPADAERFWSKVDQSGGVDSCWPWKGYRDRDGYGRFRRDGGAIQAHRFAYELDRGIPPTDCVCHHCDNPACQNPTHLFGGSNADNVADKVAKGRSVGRPQYGEKNGRAVLTEVAVLEIRERHAAGDGSYSTLAKEYEVSHTAIAQIIRRETWVFHNAQ